MSSAKLQAARLLPCDKKPKRKARLINEGAPKSSFTDAFLEGAARADTRTGLQGGLSYSPPCQVWLRTMYTNDGLLPTSGRRCRSASV